MEKPSPRLTERAQAERDARRAREGAALRENLRRRKEQARRKLSRDSAPNPETSKCQ